MSTSRIRSARALTALVGAAALCGSAAMAGVGTASAQPVGRAGCAALAGTALRSVEDWPARITNSSRVAPQGGPASCDVRGTITVTAKRSTSVIRFQVQVPEEWNGRYVQVGGGGFCGSIPTASGSGAGYVADGYAVASDDSGHQGSALDGSFAYDNDAAELTWGRLSEHLTSVVAKRVVAHLQGSSPAYSYFVGCSTGGRQALVEAQQFPDDFDGIVAGAPANRQSQLAPLSQGVRELQNRTADHRVILDGAAAGVVRQSVLDRCDGADGLADGIVADPRQCRVDLTTLECAEDGQTGCLSDEQVAVLDEWYHSPRASRGRELYPGGLPLGSEGGWPGLDIGSDTSLSGSGQYAEQVLRYLAFPRDPGPSYSLYDFDPRRDAGRLHATDHLYNADSTNMKAFQRRGGKLISWQGFADPLITPFGLIQYYEDVVRADGNSLRRTQQWYRTFFLSGVYHCAGGPGPSHVDWLGAIREWVERGQAPQRVIATKGGDASLTRPVYPYPLQAAYRGAGDPNDPDSFSPVVGPRGREVHVSS